MLNDSVDFRYYQVSTKTGDRFYRVNPEVTYRPVDVLLDGEWRQTVFDSVDELVALLGGAGVLTDGARARQVSANEVPDPSVPKPARIEVADTFGGAPGVR